MNKPTMLYGIDGMSFAPILSQSALNNLEKMTGYKYKPSKLPKKNPFTMAMYKRQSQLKKVK